MVAMFEKVAFHTTFFGTFLRNRLAGWFTQGFAPAVKGAPPIEPLAALTPGNLLSTPSLWIGLIFAAIFLAAAARMRRGRGPI